MNRGALPVQKRVDPLKWTTEYTIHMQNKRDDNKLSHERIMVKQFEGSKKTFHKLSKSIVFTFLSEIYNK